MLCSQCHAEEAKVRFEGVVNGKNVAADLCAACAQKAGIGWATGPGPVNFPSLSPVMADLFGLLAGWNPPPAAAACPRCRWTLAHFRRTGRMGCPDCYTHFRKTAQDVLTRVHGSALHKGRRPANEASRTKTREKKETGADLRAQLERAVRDERFEDAAALRDRIRSIGEKPG